MSTTTRRCLDALTVVLLLPLIACGTGEEAAVPDAGAALERAGPAVGSGSGDRQLSLPRPTGERQIGARLLEYRIELTRDTVPPGEVEFHVVNAGTTTHYLLLRGGEAFASTQHLPPGDSAVLSVFLAPGEYQLVCTIRDETDHISEGMRRQLVVR
jgi:plastocyanin